MRTFVQKPKATQQTSSAKSKVHGRRRFGQNNELGSILHLQRTNRNQAVQRLLEINTWDVKENSTSTQNARFGHDFSRIPIYPPAAGPIQTKLAINKPGDKFEQEADRVSEQVMCISEPQLQRARPCGGGCPKYRAEQRSQEHEIMQTRRVQANDGGETVIPTIVHKVLRAPGQPLDSATRRFFELRFRHDFRQVRVHTDAKAIASAQAVNARAYTVGQEIVLGRGQYAPETGAGRRLLAHELTHVVQQSSERSLYGTYLQRSCAQNSNESFYQNSPNYCRDTGFTGLLHPGQECYREVPRRSWYFSCPSGDQVCFDKQGVCHDSRDKVSPVDKKNSDGTCNLHFVCSLGHGVVDVVPPMMANVSRGQKECAESCKDLPWYTRGFCLKGCGPFPGPGH